MHAKALDLLFVCTETTSRTAPPRRCAWSGRRKPTSSPRSRRHQRALRAPARRRQPDGPRDAPAACTSRARSPRTSCAGSRTSQPTSGSWASATGSTRTTTRGRRSSRTWPTRCCPSSVSKTRCSTWLDELESIALADDYFVERRLYPNVDFYTGLIYKAMGFPNRMFTVLFALGRLPGWIAQWRELMPTPRPRSAGPDRFTLARRSATTDRSCSAESSIAGIRSAQRGCRRGAPGGPDRPGRAGLRATRCWSPTLDGGDAECDRVGRPPRRPPTTPARDRRRRPGHLVAPSAVAPGHAVCEREQAVTIAAEGCRVLAGGSTGQQDNVPGSCIPVSAAASARASASCRAYAVGKALRCTSCAAPR
jgi:hypothetical protein